MNFLETIGIFDKSAPKRLTGPVFGQARAITARECFRTQTPCHRIVHESRIKRSCHEFELEMKISKTKNIKF